MTCYSVQPRDRIFVRVYGFLYCARNMVKNLSKSISCKYKLLDHAKQFATDTLKTTSKRAIQETTEATDDLIGNKIAGKITRVSKTSPQDNSEAN